MRCALLFLCATAVLAQPMVAQDEGSGSHDRSDCPEIMRPMVRAFSFHMRDDRPALGISTTSGGMRDTLGLLVTGVANDGPADKAGIEEGDRLQTVNGTDLRLAPADASDREMRGLMARRLIRVLDKLKPGDAVELRVYADGKVRTVKVTTEKASEAFRDDAGFGLTQGLIDGPMVGLEQLGGQVALLGGEQLQGFKAEIGRLQDGLGDFRYEWAPPGAIQFSAPLAPPAPLAPGAPSLPPGSLAAPPDVPRRIMRIDAPVPVPAGVPGDAVM
jgi:hypothetical protein